MLDPPDAKATPGRPGHRVWSVRHAEPADAAGRSSRRTHHPRHPHRATHAEVSFPGDAQVTALFVTRANGGGRANSAARKRATRRNERAILKDIGALGDHYDVDVRSTTLTNLTPGEAIIREAKRGYDLVVLGVSRRPGETLFFGDTAASVLERSDTSNLFVAS